MSWSLPRRHNTSRASVPCGATTIGGAEVLPARGFILSTGGAEVEEVEVEEEEEQREEELRAGTMLRRG